MSVMSPGFQGLVQHEILLDGTPLNIRRIEPQDTARLQAFHQRLEFESIYLRHLNYKQELSHTEATQLCTVDTYNRMAFVATCWVDGEENIVGVVRYDRLGRDDANRAVIAIIVQDAYQRRGLGTLLFRRLISYARVRGIKKFVATFLIENAGVLRLIKRCGLPTNLTSFELGRLQACICIDPTVKC